MSRVVEHLAELTGYRDRDRLDANLAVTLREMLPLQSVAVYRCVSQAPQRWLLRARLAQGDVASTADPLWSEIEGLPAVQSFPDRFRCLTQAAEFSVPGEPVKSYFALTSERGAVGVLELETAKKLSATNSRLVKSILRVYRNFESLLDYSERDTLTGLLNRKTFEESFQRIASQPGAHAESTGSTETRRTAPEASIWLAVVDIDHFKRVNDGFGHLIGDEVLLLISRLMVATFRFRDHLYRFGGEEFVVLMRCCDSGDAARAMERLRSNVQGYAFPQVGQITVSVGFTELRAGDSPSGAFERADQAVYFAKEHGRNQIRDHAELVAQGHLTDAVHRSDVELF